MTEEHDCLTCKFFQFEECDDNHTYGDCACPDRPVNTEYMLVEDCPYWVSENNIVGDDED